MKDIIIDTSSFFVTLKCNLRCKHCCTGAPYAKDSEHLPLDNLEYAIGRCFEVVKYIRKFSFTGGEPLLRTDLDCLINKVLLHKEQFDVFEIVTNGTIVPDERVVDVISQNSDKMYVMIDRYGELSINADKAYDIFRSSGIECHIREYGGGNAYSGGWVDLGSYTRKHSLDEAKKIFKSCNIVNKKKTNTATRDMFSFSDSGDFLIIYCTIFNGQLHYCGRSAATLRTLGMSQNAGDYTDIVDPNVNITDIRERIVNMYRARTPTACAYCNGELDSSPRVVPAQQIQ